MCCNTIGPITFRRRQRLDAQDFGKTLTPPCGDDGPRKQKPSGITPYKLSLTIDRSVSRISATAEVGRNPDSHRNPGM